MGNEARPSASIALWCENNLGSPAMEVLAHQHHLTEALGVRLADGRQVMLKVREASPRIAGCAETQRFLGERGLPLPRLLAGPLQLESDGPPRLVTAEEWLPGGEVWLGTNAPRRYAQLFARLVAAAPGVDQVPSLEPPVPWLHYDHGAPGRLWPPPASDRWDPHRIESQLPASIPDIGWRVRRRLLARDAAALPKIVAHGDFEAQNTRWFPDPADPDGVRPVVLDWDSVVALPEAVVVGNAAAGFVSPDQPALATLDQTRNFLDAYLEQRERAFTEAERQVSYATGLWVAAYNAAFEHLKGGPGRVTAELLAQARARLALAGV